MRVPRAAAPNAEFMLTELGRIPFLNDASCRDGDGFTLLTELMEERNSTDSDTVEQARAVCNACPARGACLAWVITDEKPAGRWGGMYGGLTPKQRQMRYDRLDRAQRLAAARGALSEAG